MKVNPLHPFNIEFTSIGLAAVLGTDPAHIIHMCTNCCKIGWSRRAKVPYTFILCQQFMVRQPCQPVRNICKAAASDSKSLVGGKIDAVNLEVLYINGSMGYMLHCICYYINIRLDLPCCTYYSFHIHDASCNIGGIHDAQKTCILIYESCDYLRIYLSGFLIGTGNPQFLACLVAVVGNCIESRGMFQN